MLRFTRFFREPDNGSNGAAGASPGSAAGSNPVEAAPAGAATQLPAEFLRMIPGGDLLIPKDDAAKPEPVEPTDDLDPDPAKKVEEDEIPEEESQKPYVTKMQKRIDKLTAQRELAREEADEIKQERDQLKQQLEEAQQNPAAATPSQSANPLSTITSTDKLQEAISHAKKVRDWARENWDGATIMGEDKQEKELTAAEVRKIYAHHDDILTEHAPVQREYIRALAEQTAQAHERFPWLKNHDSEEYRLRTQVLTALPEIKRFADYEDFLATWVIGKQTLAKSQAPAGAAASVAKKVIALAPTPPGAGNPTPKKSVPETKSTNNTAALDRLKANPSSHEALLAAIAS